MTAPRYVVLEDDPTGVQLLHGVTLVTDDDAATLAAAAATGTAAIHVVTNSRALSPERAEAVVEHAARRAAAVLPGATILLRGDSTLRAHVLEEYRALARVAHPDRDPVLVLLPALPPAGRITRDGVHRLRVDGADVPVHETEYARDGDFAYGTSDLLQWAEERSAGALRARDGAGLAVAPLRAGGRDAVLAILRRLAASGAPAVFAPDSETLEDQALLGAGVRAALQEQIPLVVRTSPSSVGALCRTLAPAPVAMPRGHTLVVCGSYVPGTTRQLERLADAHPDAMVELDLDAADPVADAAEAIAARLRDGGLAVLSTPRDRAPHRRSLAAGAGVMDLLTAVVARVAPAADVVIAKGGITSAEVMRRGLGANLAAVAGPLEPAGVLLRAGGGAAGKPYVIVPGNIGAPDLLRSLVEQSLALSVLPDTV
ncbi:MAG TPA: four-carbon acid sugar kinase family protein [Baekduia sp.]